jgi:hypothetical protein
MFFIVDRERERAAAARSLDREAGRSSCIDSRPKQTANTAFYFFEKKNSEMRSGKKKESTCTVHYIPVHYLGVVCM